MPVLYVRLLRLLVLSVVVSRCSGPTSPELLFPPDVTRNLQRLLDEAWTVVVTVEAVEGEMCFPLSAVGESSTFPISIIEEGDNLSLTFGDWIDQVTYRGRITTNRFSLSWISSTYQYTCGPDTYLYLVELDGTFTEDRRSFTAEERNIYRFASGKTVRITRRWEGRRGAPIGAARLR